jgi:hypothetical protein
MTAININDPETVALVRAFAKAGGTSMTAAVNRAVRGAMDERGIPLPKPAQPKGTSKKALEARLDAALRAFTLDYTRLRNEVLGTRGGGSYIYRMIRTHGAVEALRRVLQHPFKPGDTVGLAFLAKCKRLELAIEHLALDPVYAPIVDEATRIRARANLAVAEKVAAG